MSKFERARQKAHEYYFQKWAGHEPITPAFGQKVYLTRSGWAHITHNFTTRTQAELLKRFKLLSAAKKLLGTKESVDQHRKDHFGHYFAFVGKEGNQGFKVVVRSRTITSRKYFYSLMPIEEQKM